MSTHTTVHPCIAFLLGTGLGLLASVGAQKMLNSHYQATCNYRPGHNLIYNRPGHNLIYIRGFLGDTYYCVKGAEYKVN